MLYETKMKTDYSEHNLACLSTQCATFQKYKFRWMSYLAVFFLPNGNEMQATENCSDWDPHARAAPNMWSGYNTKQEVPMRMRREISKQYVNAQIIPHESVNWVPSSEN